MQEPKSTLVKIGDFVFKYRNMLFPVILVGLCLWSAPVNTFNGSEAAGRAMDFIAFGIVIAGLAVRAAVIGYKYIKRGGLDKQVYADTLVTQGFFAVCRNPLYVGNMLMYLGIFLMHGDMMVFVVGMALFTFIYTAIIAAEEYFLRGKFGEQYEAYCRDVRCWVPRLNRLPAATRGMKFHWRRVIAKDYTTIINGMFAVLGMEWWEEIASREPINWALFFGSALFLLAAQGGIRVVKKRGLLGDVA